MKKAILYLSCVSTLAISNAIAGNNDPDLVLVREDYFNQLLSQAQMREQAPVQSLAEAQVPDSASVSLSTYQQQLRTEWEAGRIGSRAWEELGKPNFPLSIALTPAIQETLQLYSSGEVDIFYLGRGDFTLRVGKKVNRKIFKIH